MAKKKIKIAEIGDDIPEYRLPVLRDRDGDLSKRWYVEYYVWDANKNNGRGKLIRKQKTAPLSMDAMERREFLQPYLDELSVALPMGRHIRKNTEGNKDEVYKKDITAIEAYMKIVLVKKATLKKRSFISYRNAANRFMQYLKQFNMQEMMLYELSKDFCIEYLDWYQEEFRVGNRTRNNIMTYLRTMAYDLKDRGYVEENPWAGIKKERTKVSQNFPFSAHHKELLFPHLQEDPQLWYACQFLYYLFIRVQEMEQMRIGQIRWNQKVVIIDNTFKSGAPKAKKISKSCEKMIEEMGILKMNPDWYIFGSQGKPGPYPTKPDTLSKRFRDLRRALDIDEKYKFYSWKHTGNLDAVLAGVNIKAIQSQNGHVNIEDTDKYLRSLGIEHNQQIRDRQPSFDGPGPTPEKN